jgi:preprotein translocase subunit SecA
MNAQREVIYGERQKILQGEDLKGQALEFVDEVVRGIVDEYLPADVFPEEWELDALVTGVNEVYPVKATEAELRELGDVVAIQDQLVEDAVEAYETKETTVGEEVMRELERVVLLNITDTKWREHLYEMDYLQEGIHLRAYGQRDPLTEYRREAFSMFEELVASIRRDFVKYIYRVELVRQDQQQPRAPQRTQENKAEVESGSTGGAGAPPVNTGASAQAVSDKVPRNAPCPCGSGKKYKKCHGLEV